MLNTWDRQYPGRLETIFRSLQNIELSQLADRELFDFRGLEALRGHSDTEQDAADRTQPQGP